MLVVDVGYYIDLVWNNMVYGVGVGYEYCDGREGFVFELFCFYFFLCYGICEYIFLVEFN